MSSPIDIRKALADQIAVWMENTVNVRWHEIFANSDVPRPSIAIEPDTGDYIVYQQSLAPGLVAAREMRLIARVLVDTAGNEENAAVKLNDLIAWDAQLSVQGAVEDDHTLGGVVQDCYVERVRVVSEANGEAEVVIVVMP